MGPGHGPGAASWLSAPALGVGAGAGRFSVSSEQVHAGPSVQDLLCGSQ